MRVRYNRGARADLDEILAYISERNPAAAARLLERFLVTERLLSRFPEIGSKTMRKNLRRMVIGSYIMAYEIASDVILIHYIRHSARSRASENE
jgi:plasmid stabilization system protein ParE